jgi:hypothetical protein
MAPHMNVVRAYGHTAGQAIAQFWGWFKALGEQPHIAFPALAKSYGWDPSIYYGQQQRAQQQQQQTQQAGGGQIDPQLYQYLQSVEHRLGAQQQMNEAHQMAQTQQVLADFAKDKPHFEKVRRRMGELLAPRPDGTSIIPLTPEGHVDLSTAYTMACNLDDTIREQMIAERIAQEKRAAKEAADKARRAGVSFAPTSPGKNTGLEQQRQAEAFDSARDDRGRYRFKPRRRSNLSHADRQEGALSPNQKMGG